MGVSENRGTFRAGYYKGTIRGPLKNSIRVYRASENGGTLFWGPYKRTYIWGSLFSETPI